jgi:Na+-transporting NADH:ubiquinone oxidoreductase subunit D
MSPGKTTSGSDAFFAMLWKENPVFVQILGICSALAVTNLVVNTFVMGVGLVFTSAMANLTVSLLRQHTPRRVRMVTQILIIAAYVIVVKTVLDAFLPAVSKDLGPYVGLIITNCIIMGRCEAFAASNPPLASFLDGVGAGTGYTLVLLAVAVVREPLGLGTFAGYRVMTADWTNWNLMIIAPGGFFMLAIVIWAVRAIEERRQQQAG